MLTAARLPRFPPASGFDDGAMQLALRTVILLGNGIEIVIARQAGSRSMGVRQVGRYSPREPQMLNATTLLAEELG